MSTTENTTAIEEKKTGETVNPKSNLVSFLSNYISSIVLTIGVCVVVIGTLGLYTTKVAQANILPDNIDLAPFTDINRVVNDIPIDINIIHDMSLSGKTNRILSQKAIFESQKYLESFKNNWFLCNLKKNASPTSGLFANGPLFFSKVYEALISKNYLFINTIFLYLSYLPESLIMLVYGFFGIFIWFGLYIFNFIVSIFYHIVNIPNLFRHSLEKDDTTWEAESDISFLRLTKLVLFFFLWIPVGFMSSIIMPLITTFLGLTSPLTAKYKVEGMNREFSILDFLIDTIVYKKKFIFILATLSLISNSYKVFGASSLIGVLVAIIVGYFIGLYNQEIPEPSNSNGFSLGLKNTEIKQAKVSSNKDTKINICTKIKEAKNKGEESNVMTGGSKTSKMKKYNIRFF